MAKTVMLYLSVAPKPNKLPIFLEHNIGVMNTLLINYSPAYMNAFPYWGADNGCFSQPHKFNMDAYMKWLQKNQRLAPKCLFATAPDVLSNAVETCRRASFTLPRIRRLGYKAALVAQNGLTPDMVDWDILDCLFIGGSTEWKLGQEAATVAEAAKQRGKWVHMGRVNSYKRMRYAADIGCDSCDGTILAYAPDKQLEQLIRWLEKIHAA